MKRFAVWCTTFGDEESGAMIFEAWSSSDAAEEWGQNYYDNGNDPFHEVDLDVRCIDDGEMFRLSLAVDWDPVFTASHRKAVKEGSRGT